MCVSSLIRGRRCNGPEFLLSSKYLINENPETASLKISRRAHGRWDTSRLEHRGDRSGLYRDDSRCDGHLFGIGVDNTNVGVKAKALRARDDNKLVVCSAASIYILQIMTLA